MYFPCKFLIISVPAFRRRRNVAIHMHERGLARTFWLVLLIIAGWGGLVRYLIDVKQSKATWSWINALAR